MEITNKEKPKNRLSHPDRVSLSQESLSRIGDWLKEIEPRLKGSRITKSDLVNFVISTHSAHLSEREFEQLQSQHFDEVRFAAWALGQLKINRAKGKVISLADIISEAQSTKKKGDDDGSSTVNSSK